MTAVESQRWFWLGCALQAGLGVLAAGWFVWQGQPLEPLFEGGWREIGLGIAASLPLLMFFHRVMTTRDGPFAPVRLFLEQFLHPILRGWSISQLACLSLLAGIGEELLFRGAIQGGISDRWGEVPGLLVASALFGLAHGVNRTYALTAAVAGVYLGLLAQVSGSLLCPILTHALYDFFALLWFLKSGHRPLGIERNPDDPLPGKGNGQPD